MRTDRAVDPATPVTRVPQLLAAYSDLALELDANGICVSLRGLAARTTDVESGRALSQYVGKTLQSILPPALASQAIARCNVSRAQGSVEIFDCAIDWQGEARTFEGTTFSWHTGSMMLLRDVTERRTTEAQLRETEARFRLMADNAPVMLWMAGTDGRCNFFNQVWLQFTGRTMAQEQGEGWAEGVHFEDLQLCMTTYLEAFVARRPFAMEYRLRRRDGAYRWIYDQAAPRYEPDGTFAGFIGSCVDIHDSQEIRHALVRATYELRENDARTRAILDSVVEPILAIDGEGRIISMNLAAIALFGIADESVTGLDIRELLELPWPPPSEVLRTHAHAGDLYLPVEVRARRQDGKFFHAEIALTHATSAGPARYTLVVRDRTQGRLHELRILESNDAVQQRIGRDLHDGLGQLLTGIAFLAKELESDVQPQAAPKINRLVALIERGISTTQNLARGLSPLHLEDVVLADALRDLAERTAATNQIRCEFHGSDPAVEPSASERMHLFLIAQEAIANALRHGHATEIQLDLLCDAEQQTLRVRDNGGGMVFPPRARGIGLTSMSQRARAIGGRLEITKAPSGGVEIRCSW